MVTPGSVVCFTAMSRQVANAKKMPTPTPSRNVMKNIATSSARSTHCRTRMMNSNSRVSNSDTATTTMMDELTARGIHFSNGARNNITAKHNSAAKKLVI